MEDQSFDRLTKKLASPLSRRGILKAAAASVTGAILVKVDGGHALAADKTCSAAGDKCNPGHDCCAGLVCNPTGPGANGTCGCPSGMVSSGGQCVCSSTGQPPCGSTCCLKCQACDSTGHCVDICPLTQPCSTCSATTAAPAGTCVSKCAANQTCCCGTCSDTSGNPLNCGTCGNVCPTPPNTTGPACTGGNCGYQSCKPGFLDCDGNPANGCEVNPANDSNNCGGCGKACPSGQHCSSGTCTCTGTPCTTDMSCCTGYFCQGGVCNLQETTGQPCSANDQCQSGNCSNGTCCPGGTTNCGGTCTNTQSDTANCGGCGHVCNSTNGTATCSAGMCGITCNAGFADCDGISANGCETSLTTVTNCGACGTVCPGYQQQFDNVTCQSGSCTFTCQGEHYDVDNDPNDGCEVADSPVGNHIQPAAIRLVSQSCFDNVVTTVSGLLPSDRRVHENPAVVGFDSSTGSAPDWFVVRGTGGTFCSNDVMATLQMSGSADPTCYRLTVITNMRTDSCVPSSTTGACTIADGGGAYSTDSDIYFEVSKICSAASIIEAPSYTVQFHL